MMYRKISKSAEALLDNANEVLKESKSTEALLDIPWHWRHEVEIVYLYLCKVLFHWRTPVKICTVPFWAILV